MGEAREETGLADLRIIRKFGIAPHDMRALGLTEVHPRHYFKLDCHEDPPETRIAFENLPSDGTAGPIALSFYWVDLEAVPPLCGD